MHGHAAHRRRCAPALSALLLFQRSLSIPTPSTPLGLTIGLLMPIGSLSSMLAIARLPVGLAASRSGLVVHLSARANEHHKGRRYSSHRGRRCDTFRIRLEDARSFLLSAAWPRSSHGDMRCVPESRWRSQCMQTERGYARRETRYPSGGLGRMPGLLMIGRVPRVTIPAKQHDDKHHRARQAELPLEQTATGKDTEAGHANQQEPDNHRGARHF